MCNVKSAIVHARVLLDVNGILIEDVALFRVFLSRPMHDSLLDSTRLQAYGLREDIH